MGREFVDLDAGAGADAGAEDGGGERERDKLRNWVVEWVDGRRCVVLH